MLILNSIFFLFLYLKIITSGIFKSTIDKNNKLNTGFIWASGNNYIRKIFNINTSVIKNKPILT